MSLAARLWSPEFRRKGEDGTRQSARRRFEPAKPAAQRFRWGYAGPAVAEPGVAGLRQKQRRIELQRELSKALPGDGPEALARPVRSFARSGPSGHGS